MRGRAVRELKAVLFALKVRLQSEAFKWIFISVFEHMIKIVEYPRKGMVEKVKKEARFLICRIG